MVMCLVLLLVLVQFDMTYLLISMGDFLFPQQKGRRSRLRGVGNRVGRTGRRAGSGDYQRDIKKITDPDMILNGSMGLASPWPRWQYRLPTLVWAPVAALPAEIIIVSGCSTYCRHPYRLWW